MNEITTTTNQLTEIAARYTLSAQIAKGMSAASLLPTHLKTVKIEGKIVRLSREEIEANCLLICNQALRWGVDPFALAPESYVVGGKLAYQGKLVLAIVNKLAGLKENLRATFSGEGDGRRCVMSGTIKGETKVREADLDVKKAKTDNEMWTKDPDQKLIYSTAIRWARRHKPEVLLGIVDNVDEPVTTLDAWARDRVMPALPEVSIEPIVADFEVDAITDTVGEIYHKRLNAATDDGLLRTLADKVRNEPVDVVDAEIQDALLEFASEKLSTIYENQITMVGTRAAITTLVDQIKADMYLFPDHNESLIRYARERFKTLPVEADEVDA